MSLLKGFISNLTAMEEATTNRSTDRTFMMETIDGTNASQQLRVN